jgi:hypothetical protein
MTTSRAAAANRAAAEQLSKEILLVLPLDALFAFMTRGSEPEVCTAYAGYHVSFVRCDCGIMTDERVVRILTSAGRSCNPADKEDSSVVTARDSVFARLCGMC